jgi:glutamate/tyrosine decarboxylase-like PLP-dependent enzyme
MHEQLSNDLAELDALLERVKTQGLDYLHTLTKRPTTSRQAYTQGASLPVQGVGTSGALVQFNNRFEPLMVASSGPRYWGFVTGGTTPAAIAGDWLTTVYDQNPQAVNGQADISANIEVETIQLLLDLFDLPKDFRGGFVTGATMSNFTSLAVARQWVGKIQGYDIAREGMRMNIPVLCTTPHSSAIKSLGLLGMGSNHITIIPTQVGNREAMDMEQLEQAIVALEGQPFILITSGGTVNTVDFDDFETIARLRQQHQCWWHIDAAFGGFAACVPAYKHLLNGWETADSITIDCHKWLNVPYESAVFFIKEKHQLLQVETFQNSNAPYLGDPMENFSYLNFLPENSRRLKALPAWFSLMAYGKKGIGDIVEHGIAMAQLFGAYIAANTAFELLAPVRLNTVCFTLSGAAGQAKVQDFLQRLNATGTVFMTPTFYKGKKGIRAAMVNWRTTAEDIRLVTATMDALLQEG